MVYIYGIIVGIHLLVFGIILDLDVFDLAGPSYMNKAPCFDGMNNRHHCPFCFGERAKMCWQITSVVTKGFDDFIAAMQHVFDGGNYIDYT